MDRPAGGEQAAVGDDRDGGSREGLGAADGRRPQAGGDEESRRAVDGEEAPLAVPGEAGEDEGTVRRQGDRRAAREELAERKAAVKRRGTASGLVITTEVV
jgi:hypothetical protein